MNAKMQSKNLFMKTSRPILKIFLKIVHKHLNMFMQQEKMKVQGIEVFGKNSLIPLCLRIDDPSNQLRGVRYFSKIYLRSGYHQLRSKEDGIPKMAFRIRYGDSTDLVMSFGLKKASVAFMDLMNRIFNPYLVMFIVVFTDDIDLFTRCKEE